jgi:tRNA A-37 threonylcarbamoyl transferase component Bud32
LSVPIGYERLLLGHAVAVARSDFAFSIRRAIVGADGARNTLHEFAARHPSARALQGRATAFAVTLPQGPARVVVRHNRHGGLLGSITGDLFLAPTRAPHELEISLELTRLGVPTPEIIAYVVYPPGNLLQRSDVASKEIKGGRDLADILTRDGGPERAAAFAATSVLLGTLARAGARHADLNAKNVLLTYETAFVLDVDRVTLGEEPGEAMEANLARLARSLRKWRDQFNARISERDISELESAARRALTPRA